ncbi:MAG: hypothetical protein OXT67_02095 [Zetaproteobacteria bacterium]|nr:hypothetical protein [Zetaproteobacteria bacterium]
MTLSFWVILGISDLLLLAAIFYFRRGRVIDKQLLHDITEEHRRTHELMHKVKEEIMLAHDNENSKMRQMNQLAAETEQSLENFRLESEQLWRQQVTEMEQVIDQIIEKSKLTQVDLSVCLEKSKRCRDRLNRSLQRAETLAQFFSKDIPYDQIMRDIEMKKYEEAKRMLREGYDRQSVAAEVGLSMTEIDLIEGLAGHQLLSQA